MISREQQIKFMTEAMKRRKEKIERWSAMGLLNTLDDDQKQQSLNMPDHAIGKPPLTRAALDREFDA